MAIGDPSAPEDFGRRIGGNSRNIGRKRPRPHPIGDRASVAGRLPAEFSEFRLKDGRTFGAVMGADFFGPPSGAGGGQPLPQDFHEKLREGNSPLSRIVRENPDRFAPRPEPEPLIFNRDNAGASAATPGMGSFGEEAPASLPGPAKVAPPLSAPTRGSGFAATASGVLDAADDALLPGKLLDDEGRASFRRATGYGLMPGEGGLTLTSPSGRGLFDLADEDAAELARIWSPEIADRVSTMGLLWREDLTPAEKRKLLAGAIGADKLAPISRPGSGRGRPAGDPAKILARRRLEAYDSLVGAMERGASDEEIGELLEDFQTEMLPEVFGTGRFVREFLMDAAPGLGNLRSIRHFQNDIAEIDRAIETGEWGDAAWASGMAVLDAIGILPGGNVLKAGGRRLIKTIPYLDGLMAERTIRRFKAQWFDTDIPSIGAQNIFGADALAGLSQSDIDSLDGLIRNRFGKAGGEKQLFKLGKRMDPKAGDQFEVLLPEGPGFRSEKRIFDLRARYRSDIIEEKSALGGRLARWIAGAGKQVDEPIGGHPRTFELKAGGQNKSTAQIRKDKRIRENPDLADKLEVGGIDDLRMTRGDVPMKFVIDDLVGHLNRWVDENKLSRSNSDMLMRAMRQMHSNGVLTITVENYATLLVRLGATTARRTEIEGRDDARAIGPDHP